MVKLVVFSMVVAACGSVNNTIVDAKGQQLDAPADGSGSGSGTVCGAAGQTCCANSACSTGLACTTADQVCRAGEVWIAAANGDTSGTATIAHGDGTTFSLDPLGTGRPTAIYGTSASDVWVIVQGPNALANNAQTSWARHWDGNSWGAQINFPTGFIVYGLWGSAPDNYWAVNNAGAALHWNGTAWAAPQVISAGIVFSQVWGSSATDISALGGATVGHWDGTGNWSAAARTDFSVLFGGAISGRDSSQTMLAGGLDASNPQKPAVLRKTGSQFSVETLGDGTDCAATSAVWDGPDDAWALTEAQIQISNCDQHPTVVHYANGTWTGMGKLPNARSASAMWGTSNRDLFVTGVADSNSAPTLFRYNGTAWAPAFSSTAVTGFVALWGTGQPL